MEATEEEMRAHAERMAAMEAKYAQRANVDDVSMPAAMPAVKANEQGGEISMSVDDTNKLRISLGLKPLTASSSSKVDEAKAEHRRHKDAQAAREKKANEDAAREKIAAAKERRRLEAQLKKTKALGADDEHSDDVGSWLRAQKTAETTKSSEPTGDTEAAGAGRRSKRPKTVDVTDQELNLKGVKVKGSAVDMEAGETMILTLADADILADDGNIAEEADVLEDYDKLQQQQIDLAKKKAKKKDLHFEEDGKRHNMLSKYDDDDDEDMLLEINEDATIDDSARKAAVAARLDANAPPQFRSLEEKFGHVSEYMTAEEVEKATFKKRKKRGEGGGKARKVRKRVADDDEDAAGGGGAGNLFDELEAAAMDVDDEGNRGNRETRQKKDLENAAKEAQAERERAAAFDLALEKANYAAMAARARDELNAAQDSIGAEDDEKELEAMLAKARSRTKRERPAHADGDDEDDALAKLAANVHKERDEEEKLQADLLLGGDVIGETHDFVSGLVIDAPAEEGGADLEIHPPDDEPPGVKEEPEPAPPAADVGGWVTAEPDPEADTADLSAAPANARASGRRFRNKNKGGGADGGGGGGEAGPSAAPAQPPEEVLPLVGRQGGIRRGLAAALQLLRDTGTLKDTVSWAGRASDYKGVRLERVKEALLDDEDELAAEVAAALQRRDEFGRIQTPKESFRDISYAFHGMTKAVSKKEKNIKAVTNELNTKNALSADNPSQLLDMYKMGLWKPPKMKKLGQGLVKKGGGKRDGKNGAKGGG